ncbi:MAG: type II secretion system protein [Candidatus Omnitrophica bacterium]|nr:type II secretion system protein [Candidatus Omnitrophota bacterium]
MWLISKSKITGGKIKGFTLIEMLVSLVVFGLIMATAGGAFYKVYQDWQRQKKYLECIENARWAMETMSGEIRQNKSSLVKAIGSGKTLMLKNSGAPGKERFERANRLATDDLLRIRINGGGPQQNEELANFIVNNPSGNDTFSDDNNGLATIELTVRPDPVTATAGTNNRNFTLRTKVQARM